MKTLTLTSPAKINLFLHITGKRADGYHNLQTVFRLIDFCDEMHFVVLDRQRPCLDAPPVALIADSHITQNPADNLIIKAGKALYDFVKKQNSLTPEKLANLPMVQIKLKKNIPTGAGLGGGSSNCATTLLALNQLWDLKLNNEQLRTIGAKLGADVPIFIFGQDAIAEGIGEILTPITFPPQRFLLLTPNAHINTAQLFAHPTLRRDCPVFSLKGIEQEKLDFFNQLSPKFSNVFESVVSGLSAEVKNALDYLHSLEKFTQSVARMSGSGSSVFLPMSDTIAQEQLENWMENAPCPAFIVNTLPSNYIQQQITNNFCKKH